MTFATPWGLLALLAIPVIIAIHLFRRRFPVRPVAGLFLWNIAKQTPESGGRITKLPITTSLLLECLAALALALILAGARIQPAGVSQHLVVLLDDSASMAALNGASESTRDRAVRRVRSEIDRLPSSTRVSIVASGERPTILLGPAALALEAPTALESWTPDAQHHSMALGVRLARELAGQTGMLMVVSDVDATPRGEPNFANGQWVALGQPVANAGITAAQREAADDGRSTLFLTVGSNAKAPAARRLTVHAGEQQVLAQDLQVPPGASSLSLPLPAELPAVRVSLGSDGLRRDDDVMLARPHPRTVAVENALPEGRGRTALINALNALSGVTAAESGHLAFVDAAQLDRPRANDVWRVGFGRPPASWIASSAPQDFIGPFVIEKRHPLLQGVTLDGVTWTGAAPLARGVVRPVISNGDHVMVGAPASPAFAGTAILFNLDLDRTNLIRSPDWPILISNLVELRRQSLPGPERWNYRSGEWIRVRLDRDPKEPLRYRCGSIERTLPSGRYVEFIAPSPGGLLQILEGEQVLYEVGVNFLDEVETALANQTQSETGELAMTAGTRAETGAASDPLFWILLVIGGLAILANWWLLAPAPRTSRSNLKRVSWS